MRTIDDLIEYTSDPKRDKKIEMIDLRFVDLFGAWHHLTLPVQRVDEKLVTQGVPFDGSSIPGFKSVHAGDMVLIPDVATAMLDPFFEHGTVALICNVAEAGTLKPFANDPRTVVGRAEELLKKEKIADKSLWGPEFEFYIFDKVVYQNDINMAYYRIDSEEADWNTGAEEGQNLGGKIPRKGGYHAMPPLDALYSVRAEMARQIEAVGIPVRYHHHEVGGPGQSEIEINLLPLQAAADAVMLIKYITKMVARGRGKTVTYMPKPLYNEAGSGMHFHQFLVRDDRSLFYQQGEYGSLGELGRKYVGGILKHGRSLLGLSCPSTNSYKRLVPGFEAPVNLCYGLANRSAAVRIPKYVDNEREMRVEFRPPDGTCNPYLTMAAQLMAGIDGILNNADAARGGYGPYDVDIAQLPVEERDRIGKMPTSLKEGLLALQEDHDYLLRGNVFRKEMIESWCSSKMRREYDEVRNRPHPYEMSLYFDC
ncbi:MAG: type I glutamate--ammonia ligase [Deltaproteobacteria bacterium]|nr:type I glutamate--ammonia ligase [Deltaproteobacteria bacterium]